MKSVIILSLFLIFVNQPPIALFIDGITKQNRYKYSTGDGYITEERTSGFKIHSYPPYRILHTSDIDTVVDGIRIVDTLKPGKYLRLVYSNADTVVYRIFRKKIAIFWHWREYILDDPKYQFPYKDWNEIERKRPLDFVQNKKWQMF